MKKFISLVLALVMALSLTTAAWGAATAPACANGATCTAHEAAIGADHYDTLVAAVADATSGQTVTMLKDVTVATTLVVDGITLDGAGHKLIADAALGNMANDVRNNTYTVVKSNVGCTLKNLTVQGGWKGILIEPTATQDTLLEKVTVVESCRGINFNNIADSNVKLTVKDSTLGGWCGVQAAGPIVFENTKFVENASARGNGLNTYDGITLNNCTFAANTELTTEDLPEGEAIAINGGTYNCVFDSPANTGTFTISGGTFSSDVSEYVADGYVLDNGVVKSDISDAKTTYNGLYLKGTNQGDVITANPVSLGYYKANAAKYDKVDGHVTAKGNVAYFLADDLAYSGVYVQVNALHQADVVAYADAAGTIVKFYLDDISDATYYEGTVFNNFGEKCGQVDMDPVAGVTYYTVKGDLTKAVYASAKTGSNLMVGGKLITVDPVPVATAYVGHTIVTESEDGELVKVYCSACKLQAVKAPNYMSIPKGAEIAVTGTNWYWPVVGGAVADDKVESAETFDAGIALYVGMSVMAATGAVVLKKKD